MVLELYQIVKGAFKSFDRAGRDFVLNELTWKGLNHDRSQEINDLNLAKSKGDESGVKKCKDRIAALDKQIEKMTEKLEVKNAHAQAEGGKMFAALFDNKTKMYDLFYKKQDEAIEKLIESLAGSIVYGEALGLSKVTLDNVIRNFIAGPLATEEFYKENPELKKIVDGVKKAYEEFQPRQDSIKQMRSEINTITALALKHEWVQGRVRRYMNELRNEIDE